MSETQIALIEHAHSNMEQLSKSIWSNSINRFIRKIQGSLKMLEAMIQDNEESEV